MTEPGLDHELLTQVKADFAGIAKVESSAPFGGCQIVMIDALKRRLTDS